MAQSRWVLPEEMFPTPFNNAYRQRMKEGRCGSSSTQSRSYTVSGCSEKRDADGYVLATTITRDGTTPLKLETSNNQHQFIIIVNGGNTLTQGSQKRWRTRRACPHW